MDQNTQAVRDGILAASKIERRRHSIRAVVGVVLIGVVVIAIVAGVRAIQMM